MLDLPQVTLVCVDCKQPETALKALQYSSKHINFAKIILLGNYKPNNVPDHIEFISIPKINSTHEYSIFVIKHLTEYINTKHCLVIQSDGFVVNPQLWKEDFLNYDYIGAPWSQQNPWVESYDARVGNGGFSLRSKKFLEFSNQFDSCNELGEDSFLCIRKYEEAIDYGIKFAPFELAVKFSYENPCVEFDGNSWDTKIFFDENKHFGWHGKNFLNTNELMSLKHR